MMEKDEISDEYNDYEKLAFEMNKALAAAKAQINPFVLGKAKGMMLEKEDYRQLGTSIFIEKNYADREAARKNGNYSGPSTEPQQGLISRLITEKEDAPGAIKQFLDTNEKKLVKDLTSSEASSLIDVLKALPKRK